MNSLLMVSFPRNLWMAATTHASTFGQLASGYSNQVTTVFPRFVLKKLWLWYYYVMDLK